MINSYKNTLVQLVDYLAPINNAFRTEKDAIKKITILWDFGNILNDYLLENNLKLHDLLYKIYNPHSNIKNSYITRDLGSYAYRIFCNFKSKKEIEEKLYGLKNYSLFREAIPLLFNEKYKIDQVEKNKIIKTITSQGDSQKIIKQLKNIKKNIVPIYNSRIQKKNDFNDEKIYLENMFNKLKGFYNDNLTLPDSVIINHSFGNSECRKEFVLILMSLASDSFLKQIDNMNTCIAGNEHNQFLSIAKKSSIDRARFRKWVMSSSQLLEIAEAINSLENESFYRNSRSKLVKQ